MDAAFGGQHTAKIDPISRHFHVTRNDNEVRDFRIVYIRGRGSGLPNHTSKVTEFPDILHISFEELKTKLFGDWLKE